MVVVTFWKGGKLSLCFFGSSQSDVLYIFIVSGPCPFEKYMSPLAAMPESQTNIGHTGNRNLNYDPDRLPKYIVRWT